MKKLLAILLLLPALVLADEVKVGGEVGGGGSFTGGTLTSELVMPPDVPFRWDIGATGANELYPQIRWTSSQNRWGVVTSATAPRTFFYLYGDATTSEPGQIYMVTYDAGLNFGLMKYDTDATDPLVHQWYFRTQAADSFSILNTGARLPNGHVLQFIDTELSGWDSVDSISLAAATPSGNTTVTLPALTGTVPVDQSPTTASYTSVADSITIDADVDNDADGTITLSTDNSGQTILLDSDSIDIDSNATLNLIGDTSVFMRSAASGTVTIGIDTGTTALQSFKPVKTNQTSHATLASSATNNKDLTDATATTTISFPTSTGDFGGGEFQYTVFAEDATDHQVRTGVVIFNYSNKGGTLICGVGTATEAVTASSGTLTCTPTCNVSTTTAQLQLNCTSSLTETTLTSYSSLVFFGTDATTPPTVTVEGGI